MKRSMLVAVLALLTLVSHVTGAEPGPKEKTGARDARMKWWREARFGMFIHWGLYAVPAGTWQGKRIDGIGEWIMDSANIPVAEYEKLATQFNPVKYDPAEWVRTAREAGIKYIVITSKHHDGFCLFDTKATNYDVVDATPYGKDLLKPLAAECRKQGLKFCVYHSIMDWHHPAQYRANEKHYNPTKIHPEKKAEFMAYMKTQLKELLEICDPEVFWFDGEWPDWYTEEDGRAVYDYLRELKPNVIINNRVGKGRQGMEGLSKGDREYAGDFGTPEQQIPATGLRGVDWESCMTMNDTWGFKSYDENWKSVETLVRNIIDTASKGGNYLLNVGPTAEGLIPAPSVERLQAIGKWMAANGEAIHATRASPFEKLPWGRATQKTVGGTTRLYLHVFDWPQDQKLVLPKLIGKPLKAYLLAGGEALTVTAGDDRTTITVPAAMPDRIATVIAVDLERPQEEAQGADNVPPRGFRALFNGRDFSGWKVPEGDGGHWKIVDGVIDYDAQSEAKGDRSLWTTEEFGDFVLRVDWRIKETPYTNPNVPYILPDGTEARDIHGKHFTMALPDSDSGIFLRGSGRNQVNIWCWPIGSGEFYGYRTDPNVSPQVRKGVTPLTQADRPVGEWNRFEITARGDRVTVVLNGKPVIRNAQLPGIAPKGALALQHHGGKQDGKWAGPPSLLQFKNIFIKELKGAAPKQKKASRI